MENGYEESSWMGINFPLPGKVLTDNLRELEDNGLLVRTVFPEVPPRVEYELSNLGMSLNPVLQEMAKWGEYFRSTL